MNAAVVAAPSERLARRSFPPCPRSSTASSLRATPIYAPLRTSQFERSTCWSRMPLSIGSIERQRRLVSELHTGLQGRRGVLAGHWVEWHPRRRLGAAVEAIKPNIERSQHRHLRVRRNGCRRRHKRRPLLNLRIRRSVGLPPPRQCRHRGEDYRGPLSCRSLRSPPPRRECRGAARPQRDRRRCGPARSRRTPRADETDPRMAVRPLIAMNLIR